MILVNHGFPATHVCIILSNYNTEIGGQHQFFIICVPDACSSAGVTYPMSDRATKYVLLRCARFINVGSSKFALPTKPAHVMITGYHLPYCCMYVALSSKILVVKFRSDIAALLRTTSLSMNLLLNQFDLNYAISILEVHIRHMAYTTHDIHLYVVRMMCNTTESELNKHGIDFDWLGGERMTQSIISCAACGYMPTTCHFSAIYLMPQRRGSS